MSVVFKFPVLHYFSLVIFQRFYVCSVAEKEHVIKALFISNVCVCVNVNVCIKFCIESMVWQTLPRRLGLNLFSAFAISTMLKLILTLTQMLRVNRS